MSNFSSESSSQNSNALWIGDQAPIQQALSNHASHPVIDIRNIDSYESPSTSGTHAFVNPDGAQGRHTLRSFARNNANCFHPYSRQTNAAHQATFRAATAGGVYRTPYFSRPARSARPRKTIIPNPENVFAWSQEVSPNSVDELSSSPDSESDEESDSEEDYASVHAVILPCPKDYTPILLPSVYRETAQAVVGPNVDIPSALICYTMRIPVDSYCLSQQCTGAAHPRKYTFHIDDHYLCPFCLEVVEDDVSGMEEHFVGCGELKSYQVAGMAKTFAYGVSQL
ncbi:hypothetical protein CPB85DRAFT_206091 [Mucidula mucida]|nr:hypothetical protein CPB85DRAFT_206091 [Mucidula mucida]